MVNSKINKLNLIAILICYLACLPTIAATYDNLNIDEDTNTLFLKDLTNQKFITFFYDEQQHGIEIKKENYNRVLKLIENTKLPEAKYEIEKLIKQEENEPAYYNLQALLAILEKNSPQAIRSYQKAIELEPNNLMAHLGMAKHALEKKDLNTAKKHAEMALTIDEQSASAYLLLADIANNQKKPNEAKDILLNALDKVKGDIKPEIKLATALIKFYAFQKKPKEILDLSQKLQKQYPDNLEALSILARAQIINKQNNLAEQTLTQIVTQNKQDADHRILLANILKPQAEKEAQVIQLLDEASIIEKDNPRALVYKATYLIQLKHFSQALNIAKKVDSQYPKLAIGKMLEGDIYLIEKKFDLALTTNLKAYKIQPNKKLLTSIVSLMTKLEQQTKAIDFLKQELTKSPDDSEIHFKLASLYQKNNSLKQAIQHYKAILTKTPEHVTTLNNLAWIYTQQDNPQAVELAKKAYTINPESATVLDTYGYALVKQGQNKEAISILKKAVQILPNHYDIQFHLAQAYSANSNSKKAIEILSPLIQEEKIFSERKSAINLLKKLNTN